MDLTLEMTSHIPASTPEAPGAALKPSPSAKLPSPPSLPLPQHPHFLFFVPQTNQACSHLQSFVLAVPTAWNTLPQELWEAISFLALRSQPSVPS